MEREISRFHKLAAPLILKRNGSSLIISDGTFKHDFDFKEFGQIKIIGSDTDGFITFEISKNHPSIITEFSKGTIVPKKSISSGFNILGRGTPKSLSSTTTRATYEYYKRTADEYYYSKIISGSKTKKIHLGSLQDHSSPIHKIVSAIQQHFREMQLFDRKMLSRYLGSAESHGQKLKSVLDILTIEGYLEKQESQKRGKPYEQYRKTSKMETIH